MKTMQQNVEEKLQLLIEAGDVSSYNTTVVTRKSGTKVVIYEIIGGNGTCYGFHLGEAYAFICGVEMATSNRES